MASKRPKSIGKSDPPPAPKGHKRANGGRRPGAGRKPKELTRLIADHNRMAHDTIGPWLPDLLLNIKALADGVRMRDDEPGEDGRFDYYVTLPDRASNEYLINRLLGKPTERSEVTGKDGSDLLVTLERKARKIYPKASTG